MSTYNTPNLAINLPTPGSSEPFSVAGINADFEKIDTWAATVATSASVTTVTNNLNTEITNRTNADTALDGRLDVLEARPKVYVQATDPTTGMVTGDLRFW
jgi:hypothetical protein